MSTFGDLGSRKKAPEPLRARAEGIQQDNEKVLLVTNIKVDGQPIGAFGDGDQRAQIVEQVDKQEDEDDFHQADA